MIADQNNAQVSEAKVLQTYFGRKIDQSIMEFFAELKALTAEDKTELANLAAKELGFSVS